MIGSVGATEFRDGPAGPELVKGAAIQVINDGPQKPGSIHTHIGQHPILAAGSTAAGHNWTTIDMAACRSDIYPLVP